jgi:CRP-like cAMP-binding protein
MSSPSGLLPVSDQGLSPFYDRLLQFSLFQGMSRAELMQMAGNTRFEFRKMPAGHQVVKEGEVCDRLFFLLKGTLDVTSYADDRSYSVGERLQAPWLMQPEALFGLSFRFTYSVRTHTECHFILLSKDEVLRLFDDFLTFRLNLLNLLSTVAQQRGHRPWRRVSPSLTDRIARFFADHSHYPAGRKEVRILMTRLALEVNDSRLDVSRALNDMQRRGLVELHRGRIIIPSLEHLFM